ncbi:MAG: DUF465 domain-containing protein [Pseudomonadota bacterium]
MEEYLTLVKKLEMLNIRHQELDATIDKLNEDKFKDEFQLHRLKKEKLMLRDEMSKLQDAIYPDIIA